jgi:hypothetical protein
MILDRRNELTGGEEHKAWNSNFVRNVIRSTESNRMLSFVHATMWKCVADFNGKTQIKETS